MKIFSIIGNYTPEGSPEKSHAPGPDWWLLPDSVLLRSGKPVFLPGEEGAFRMLPSLCLRIDRLGKCVAPRFASRYYAEVAPAIQFVDSSVLAHARTGEAVRQSDIIFDNAVIVGDFIPLPPDGPQDMKLSLNLSDGTSFNWDASAMRLQADAIVSLVSGRNILKMGDLILLALPPDGPAAMRDLSADVSVDGNHLLSFRLR